MFRKDIYFCFTIVETGNVRVSVFTNNLTRNYCRLKQEVENPIMCYRGMGLTKLNSPL